MSRARWCVVSCVALCCLTGVVGAEEAPAKPRLRVMSYNIHHGEGIDGKLDLERIAKVIKDAKVDLVAVQEVDRNTRRTKGVDQAAELARLTGMHGTFGKAMEFSGGEYGQAVLSRCPLIEPKTHRLPTTPSREQRVALEVRVRPPGLPELTFVGTHLDHVRDETDRVAQARELNRLLLHKDAGPTILVGDMNAQPDSQPIRILLEHWSDTSGKEPIPTCPADKPTIKIDWILLLKGHGWRVISSTVIEEKVASDHRPIVAELEWVGQGKAQ